MKLLKSNKTAAKRTACILTAGMMALSTGLFTACGDKNQGSGSNSAVVDQSEALKTLAYKVTDVPVNFELSGNVTCKNNLFYSVSTVYNNEGDNYFSDCDIYTGAGVGALRLCFHECAAGIFVDSLQKDYKP